MENKTNINWYPGHMAKTRREIEKTLPLIDIVYEVIDSRMPYSSRIVDLDNIIKNKPKIIISTKYDLCDKNVTDKFLDKYSETNSLLKVDLKNANNFVKDLVRVTNNKLDKINSGRINKGLNKRVYRALVVGVPNSGKSTLINVLARRKATKTGNMAGVTKNLSWIKVSNNLEVLDSPGILWPKIENQIVGYNLASLTSIKEEIIDKEAIASYVVTFLKQNYPQVLKEKYGITDFDLSLIDIFSLIGKKRGALLKGGIIDYDKVYITVINDLKNGNIKKVTFDIYK